MHPLSLKETFRQLPKSLRDICGTVIFPHDNGNSLTNSSESTPVLMGASDASFHWGKATHAWVISTGVKYDITKPNKNIFGSGPVDGLPPYLSSGRGELHGLNAISIIADLLNTYHARNSKIKVVCDIKGIVNKCRTLSINYLLSRSLISGVITWRTLNGKLDLRPSPIPTFLLTKNGLFFPPTQKLTK